ncbi:hypothetical protein PHYSODRAFT_325965 [Phytophthora sojae]|uniref:Uncharacterized protein n=1 Tax=Phytophthora sojae (strain P6497) TaxID=1094619 RepID=G4YV93_PHYSP|nr:hypothetical protein PHYSODRAFT_325965 [Phytophthora sojae]EGZ24900.1 hypothetical protein PHYSODRAFT_325965 [Phytophthora sojae]|eukprot:XP_009520188.1 hypothetical protein PHYSODRAFT_325965 [Phytophthora sojae]
MRAKESGRAAPDAGRAPSDVGRAPRAAALRATFQRGAGTTRRIAALEHILSGLPSAAAGPARSNVRGAGALAAAAPGAARANSIANARAGGPIEWHEGRSILIIVGRPPRGRSGLRSTGPPNSSPAARVKQQQGRRLPAWNAVRVAVNEERRIASI